jgi:hypothetical protein
VGGLRDLRQVRQLLRVQLLPHWHSNLLLLLLLLGSPNPSTACCCHRCGSTVTGRSRGTRQGRRLCSCCRTTNRQLLHWLLRRVCLVHWLVNRT